MSKSLELSVVIGASIAGVISAMSQVADKMKNVGNSVKELDDKMKELGKTQRTFEKMDRMRENYNKVTQQIKLTKEHLEKLKAEYEQSGHKNKELAQQIKKTEKTLETLNKQKERQKHLFEAARSSIEKEGSSLKNYRNDLVKVNSELKKTEQLKKAQARHDLRMEKSSKMSAFGDKRIKTGMTQAAAVAMPVKLAIDLEEAQADLKKVANFSSKEMEDGFYKAMRNFSESSPLSQVELFEIAGAGAQAGIAMNELEQFTKDAAQIKVAFDISTEAAGEFLAKTRNQLGLSQKEVKEYGDVINYLADSIAVTAPEIVDISQRVAGLGGMAGISKEGVAALGGTLVASGVNSEVAATGLKNISLGLVAGESATKRQKAAFEKLGLSAKQVAKDMQIDGEGTLLKVFAKIKELPKDVQAATLKDLFGKESIQSASELAKHLDELSINLANVHDKAKTGGSVTREYENRMKTLKNNMLTLKNNLVNIGTDLGNALAPSIKKIMADITPVIQKIAQFIAKNPEMATGIMKTVASFAALNFVLGGSYKIAGPVFGAISKGMLVIDKIKIAGGIAKAFPVFMKLIGFIKMVGMAINTAFLSNPVGLIIIAIVAVIAIIVVLYNKCSWFRNGVNAIFKSVATFLINTWNAIKPHVMNVINGIVSAVRQGVEFIKLIWKIIQPTVIQVWNIIKTVVGVVMQGIAIYIRTYITVIMAVWKFLQPVIQAVWNAIKVIVMVVIKIIAVYIKVYITMIKVYWNILKFAIIVVWNVIKAIVLTVIISIVVYIRVYIAIIKTLWTGLIAVARFVWNAIKGIAIAVWNAIKSGAVALWNAIKSGASSVGSFFKSTWEGIKSAAVAVWNGIKSAFDTVVNGLKSAITGVVNFFTEKWNGLKNTVSQGLGKIGGFLGIGANYAGTNYWRGGLTKVAEKGAELIKVPGKPAFLAENEMLLNLPRGTQILNNRETKNSFTDRVSSLKDRIAGLWNSNNPSGGDTYNITIQAGGGANTAEIKRLVLEALREAKNKKDRTAIV